MKIRLFVTLSALTALGTLTQAAPPVQPVAAPTAAAPKLGDADFPKPSPGGRHDEKVAAVKAGNFELAMIGDSITECVGDAGGEWEPLKAVWAKHYAPRRAINLGYSGYRTENILWNLQHGELDFASSPKVFTLLIGTNNTDDQHYPSIHTGEQVFAGTKAIVDLIKQRHPTAKILIQAILPSGGPTDRTDYNRKYNRSPKGLAAYRRANELTAQLADGKQVFWLDVGHVFLRPDASINTALMPDMIHPNAAGAEARAQAMEPVLASLLGDQPIIDPQPNPMVVPVSRTDGSYDWMERHQAILAAKATHPQIVFIGDSITHHMGGVPKPTGGFAKPLGTTFWSTVCTPERPGLNLGFGADWTQHVLWRIDHGELDGLSPKSVILMIGTNNVLNSAADSDPGLIVAGVRACILRIRAKTPDAKLILMAVLPCRNPATHPNRILGEKVNAGLRELATEAKVPLLDLKAKFLDPQGNIPTALMHDAIHPSAAGYRLWSDALLPLLN